MLVADDELWIRERIINSIKWAKIGITITGQASDGEEALMLYKELKPDIVITDIRMPVISGIEFISALRDTGINSKVIVISGYSEFDYAQKALRLGVFDYVLKPVENSELVEVVKKCIRQIEADAYINKIFEESKIRQTVTEHLENLSDSRKRNIVEKAISFIAENYHRPISLTDVAGHVMLNAAYFSKLFKDSTGGTFINYLTQYRISMAVELMKDPSLKIYEIASSVGYENVQYFTKVFKSVKGVSPYIYKEKI
ncbi:MAG: response regulator [Treponema sp.]|jgi:two-component system response regulator YesN|nr:response regulator [Treponema sp.]